ncbi:MAG: MFS transporter [Acidobacteria bacterium]|nr:MFS transporter [Acidobacteriota bacterium]MCZ6505236.1 MFS transporter [Actinomycetota bacterium]
MHRAIRRVLDPLLPVEHFTRNDRRIVFVIWVAGVVQGFAQSQASASLPFTRAGLGLSEGEMSLLLGVARLAAFAALPLGWLGDHRGRRKPFLWAMTLIVVGGSFAGLVSEAWQFGVFHAMLRTGTAVVSGLAVVLLAENTSLRIRAYAISFYGAAVSLGSGMALMSIPLADGGGEAWRIPHLLTGLAFLLLPFLIKNVPESGIYLEQPEGGHWRELISGVWASRFWVVVSIGFLASAFGAVGAAFSTERLITQVGLSTGNTVIILLVGGTLGGIGFFVGGHLADAWGRRSTSVMSLLLALAGGLTLYSVTSVPLILLAVFVSAFGTFAFVPAAGSHRAELFPTTLRSSANIAATNMALAGSALGLIIAGIYTIDTFGLRNTMLILGIGVAIAAGLTLLLPETRGQDLTAISADRR